MKKLVLVVSACVILDWIAHDVMKQRDSFQKVSSRKTTVQLCERKPHKAVRLNRLS